MPSEGPATSGVRVRLAYLCNLYPAVSHSFIRREIEAIERAGHEVHRFSIRPPRNDLRDEADMREAERTETILMHGSMRLLFAWFAMVFSRPIKSAKALAAAFRLSGPGLGQKIRHLAYLLEATWLARRLDQLGIPYLHAHFGTNPAAVAMLVQDLGGPPYSFTVHGPDEFDAPVALSLRAKIDAASFVAAVSSYGRSQLMRWSAPEQWGKIKVIRCGVDPEFLNSAVEPVPADSTELLCVARLTAQKGLPLLIAACEQLKLNGERFSLTIVGDGELGYAIENEIKSRGLDDNVALVGIRSASEIRRHLLRARAFVLPSFAEGLPVVLMEALALSRPVIATAIAGIPELVDDECGWLIPAGDEDALVEAMAQALHSSLTELAAKGRVGRDRVKDTHSADDNASLLSQAIAECSALTYTQ